MARTGDGLALFSSKAAPAQAALPRAAFIKSEVERWAGIVKHAGAELE
jgi:hypothetical protein